MGDIAVKALARSSHPLPVLDARHRSIIRLHAPNSEVAAAFRCNQTEGDACAPDMACLVRCTCCCGSLKRVDRPINVGTLGRRGRFLLHEHYDRAWSHSVLSAEDLLFLARFTQVEWRVLAGVDDPIPRLV